MPDSFLDMFCSHPRVGASSSSLNRSWKYVGWLSGFNSSPLRGNYAMYVRGLQLQTRGLGTAYPLLEAIVGEGKHGVGLLQLLGLVNDIGLGIPPLDASLDDFAELGLGAEVVLGPQGKGRPHVLVRLLWEDGVSEGDAMVGKGVKGGREERHTLVVRDMAAILG